MLYRGSRAFLYNQRMKAEVARQLVDVNRGFYQSLAAPFSASRGQLQPGVLKVLDNIPGEARVLDLGCGNGGVAAELARRAHRGQYLGMDGSAELLDAAQARAPGFEFVQTDLTTDFAKHITGPFDFVFLFAVLHHIPGQELRLELLNKSRGLLKADGTMVMSNWQFMGSPRLRERVQSWDVIGLAAAQVDEGDYLLDWRSGGTGLRYVHQFTQDELAKLAGAGGFQVADSFLSDGSGGKLSLYQRWLPKGAPPIAFK